MSDALVSPGVAVAGVAAAATLVVVATARLRKHREAPSLALMGVMGAFIFTAQMLNFAIPGTGSSGHVVGGVLLAAILGPWAGFLTLAGVIVIQCLVFADGGLLALGCNIVNMAAMTCLVAYPLIFKPIATSGGTMSGWRLSLAAVAACIIGLESGAVLVAVETWLSGITMLPLANFLMFMLPIHLAIGLCEGIATAALLVFVLKARPSLLWKMGKQGVHRNFHGVAAVIGAVVVLVALFGTAYASTDPDGLEWSLERVAGTAALPSQGAVHGHAAQLQEASAVMPEYENRFSGIAGAGLCVLLAGAGCAMFGRRKCRVAQAKSAKSEPSDRS